MAKAIRGASVSALWVWCAVSFEILQSALIPCEGEARATPSETACVEPKDYALNLFFFRFEGWNTYRHPCPQSNPTSHDSNPVFLQRQRGDSRHSCYLRQKRSCSRWALAGWSVEWTSLKRSLASPIVISCRFTDTFAWKAHRNDGRRRVILFT